MIRVQEQSKLLPEDGIPPEVLRLLPHDNDLDKFQVQTVSAPVPGRVCVTKVNDVMNRSSPNAAVDEQTRTVEHFNAEIRAFKARSK